MDLYLHIGAPKTGTTSLQNFFAENPKLAEAGILYPVTGRQTVKQLRVRHAGFTLSALPLDQTLTRFEKAFRVSGSEERTAFARSTYEDLRQETARQDARAAVISDEGLYVRLKDEDAVGRLKAGLSRTFDRIHVIAYIRSPDRYMESAYSQYLRMGGCWPFDRYVHEHMSHVHYAERLEPWRKVFGAEALHVREFERSKLIRDDVVADFCAGFLGLDPDFAADAEAERNPSLSAVGQEALRRLNARFIETGTRRPGFFRSYFSKNYPGAGVTLDRGQKQEIARALEEDIRAVSANYFGGEPVFASLFAEPSAPPAAFGEADVAAAVADAAVAYVEKARTTMADEKKRRKKRRGR